MPRFPASTDISQSLAEVLGQDIQLDTWQSVSGGSIHQAWHVHSQCGQQFFVKTNLANKYHTLEAEYLGLQTLHDHISPENPLHIPKLYTLASNEQYSWLILEYIEFGQQTPASQTALGQGLALLHQQTAPQFGFEADNVIGENLQTNGWTKDWLSFWAEQRLGTQFKLAAQHGFYNSLQDEAEQLLSLLPQLLQGHQPIPSLLHGDLWAGNAAADTKAKPFIFDPAVYYGDRECDLAMTTLFGGFSADFYAAYNHVYPLDNGYEQRKDLYNLYHILNHANLFGGGYIGQSQSMMQQLISQVS
ncbi:fructosamine kinase family protein [Ghiorsea bivora]|uniref:fructosamine kinase family protein n=1 Tax=Ghiorsea bivora TaxID=1485545 RepID=UPI00056E6FB4|nr:fructosamine kinase family protein [Ghiorsea bivora]